MHTRTHTIRRYKVHFIRTEWPIVNASSSSLSLSVSFRFPFTVVLCIVHTQQCATQPIYTCIDGQWESKKYRTWCEHERKWFALSASRIGAGVPCVSYENRKFMTTRINVLWVRVYLSLSLFYVVLLLSVFFFFCLFVTETKWHYWIWYRAV